MDAKRIRQLKPLLLEYLRRFDDCFGRRDTRGHLPVYVQGQLSDLPRKSVEPMALAGKVPVRTLQEFLSLLKWDEGRMRDRLQQLIAAEHASPHSLGIIDETGCPKKGMRTPGVQRQWCGATGKKDNCVVTVHLGYAVDDFHCLVDSDLFVPESWDQDRARCQTAGIPDTVRYRPKWQIALELYDRALVNGMGFAWMTFDEGYGGKPEFLRALADRKQLYVGEVPTTFTGWLHPPRVTHRPHQRQRGRGRKIPRIVSGGRGANGVAHHLTHTPELRDQPWVAYHVKDGSKGPMVWEMKRASLYVKDDKGLPGPLLQLVVARSVQKRDEVKFFVSNAPPETATETLLLVAFGRWHVERCFEDEKTELGLDHYEGRNYTGLKRHQAITAVSHLFLARVHQRLRGEKHRTDGLPSPHGRCGADPVLGIAGRRREAPVARDRRATPVYATGQRQSTSQPCQTNATKAKGIRHKTIRHQKVSMEYELAL